MTKSSKNYWSGLDGLRTFAFTAVFLHHCPNQFENIYDLLGKPLAKIATWGWLGVDLFFVISGFLITSLLLREQSSYSTISLKLFWTRRALRIWPLYYLVIAVVILLPIFTSVKFSASIYQNYLLKLGVPACFFVCNIPNTALNAELANFGNSFGCNTGLLSALLCPLWSLCIEEQFYIVWPLILLAVTKTSHRYFIIGIMMLASLTTRFYLITQYANDHSIWYCNSLAHCEPLLAGSLLALITLHKRSVVQFFKNYGIQAIICAGSILSLTALVCPPIFTNSYTNIFIVTVCEFAFAAIVGAVCFSSSIEKVFSHTWLRLIGQRTYAMYLWHFAVIRVVAHSCDFIPWSVQILLDFALTLCVAQVSWLILEKPIANFKTRFNHQLLPLNIDNQGLSGSSAKELVATVR